MIGRFNMGKEVGTPSMSKKKSSTGAYPPVGNSQINVS